MAFALVRHLPRTLSALESGVISEWRAQIVVAETRVLTPEQQSVVDAELFDTLGLDGVGALGDRELQRLVRAIAYRIDPESVVKRCRHAESQRRVTLRAAPDCMTYLTAYLPLAQGVAVHAALVRAAAGAHAAGDERGKGQIAADTLVKRVTGQVCADEVSVEVQVVITDRVLLSDLITGPLGEPDQTPAQVPGYGTVPAAWVRDLVRGRTDLTDRPGRKDVESRARMWLRRLYTHSADGTLVAMDSQRHLFEGGLRRFLVARDGTCLTPWCDAPVRHLDHVVDHAHGGPTSAHNGQGSACAATTPNRPRAGTFDPNPPNPPTDGARIRRHHHTHRTHLSVDCAAPAPRPAPG